MAGDGIYRKTGKGREEITTRANKLGMRERTLLIMVDDKTSRADLLARSAHPASIDILDALLAQGFIELDPATGTAAATPVATQAASVAAEPAQPASEVSMTSASRYACKALMTLLGPTADELTGRVEKARSAGELTATLEQCRQIVQGMAGKSKADEFWAGINARLPKA